MESCHAWTSWQVLRKRRGYSKSSLFSSIRVTLPRSVASGIQENQRETLKPAEEEEDASFVILPFRAQWNQAFRIRLCSIQPSHHLNSSPNFLLGLESRRLHGWDLSDSDFIHDSKNNQTADRLFFLVLLLYCIFHRAIAPLLLHVFAAFSPSLISSSWQPFYKQNKSPCASVNFKVLSGSW